MAPASFTVREIVVSRVGPHGTVPRDLDAHSVAVALTGDQGPEVVLAELEAGAAPRAAAATPHDPGNSVGGGGVQKDSAVVVGAINAAAHQGVVGATDRQFQSPNGGWCFGCVQCTACCCFRHTHTPRVVVPPCSESKHPRPERH